MDWRHLRVQIPPSSNIYENPEFIFSPDLGWPCFTGDDGITVCLFSSRTDSFSHLFFIFNVLTGEAGGVGLVPTRLLGDRERESESESGALDSGALPDEEMSTRAGRLADVGSTPKGTASLKGDLEKALTSFTQHTTALDSVELPCRHLALRIGRGFCQNNSFGGEALGRQQVGHLWRRVDLGREVLLKNKLKRSQCSSSFTENACLF